jgi:Glycolipid 2-alpha-mannosyltransferase
MIRNSPGQESVYVFKNAKDIDVITWPEERWFEGPVNETQLEKAALVMLVRYVMCENCSLCRNSELHPARATMREVEDRFNKRFGYPWVFMNDEPFTDELFLIEVN